MAVPTGRINLAVLLACCWACLEAPVTGSYLRDVELIAPSPQVAFNTVYYYPSYVKGEDPVEEFNRRRLHVDTAMFMDEGGPAVKRKRKAFPGTARRNPKLRAAGRMRSDHERDYLKIRQTSGAPRYIRDDVEIFDIEENNRIHKKETRSKPPSTRKARTATMEQGNDPRRYEESDPQIFAYERADPSPVGIARANARRHKEPEDSKYFQDTFQFQKSPLELEFGHLFETNDGWEERYERQDHRNHRHQGKVIALACLLREKYQYKLLMLQSLRNHLLFAEVFGDGSHIASSRRGNDRHYVEQFERGSHGAGVFQKKVKWADKQGGFGEHYWDLNHIQPAHDG